MKWPYFDITEYLNRYPDVAAAEMDAFEHFSRHGWREGRWASAYFDALWYANAYLDTNDGIDPISHYANGGWRQGTRPNPYFDAEWYLNTYLDVKEAGVEPLDHYVNWGWKEGRNPSPYFDVRYYLQHNGDVRETGMEPLMHFILCGWREQGRNPNPYFSGDWYRQKYQDRFDTDTCPLRHYLASGSALGLQPGPNFDPLFYRKKYSDIAPDSEPLAHFLQYGRSERRVPHPDAEPDADIAVADWAGANALNEQRIALLSRELGTPLALSSPSEVAQGTIRKYLPNVKAVTFDIFDTLVERRSGRPETIFALLDVVARQKAPQISNFVAVRKQAERNAREIAGMREITMVEIWDHFSQLTGLSAAVCTDLARHECELEITFCEAKPIGIDLLRTALEEGRAVYLLSDIYFDRDTVEAILAKAGVIGYSKLYISSEIGGTKHYGGMFKLLLSENDLIAGEVLHIGDNPHSDVAMPKSVGMLALQIEKSDAMSPSDTLRAWFNSDISNPTGLWQSIIAGELIHRDALLHVSTPSTLDIVRTAGAQALGPVLLAFAQYLAKKSRQFGHGCLYFASRDGFYLREAYEALRPVCPDLPPSRYVLASRRVCRAAGISNLDDILAVASVDHFPMPLRQFMAARFLLSDAEIDALPVSAQDLDRVITNARSDKEMHRLLESCSGAILARCMAHAAAYRDYLADTGITSPGAALVDIGYRGTTQRAIADMTGNKLDGLYMVTWPEVSGLLDRGLRYDAFLPSKGASSDPIVKYVQMLELLCSATHGSIASFEHENGVARPVMLPGDISARTGHTLNALREGALDFVHAIASSYPELLDWQPPHSAEVIGTLVEFCATPRLEVVDGLREHLFEDVFGGAVKPLIGRQGSNLGEALEDGCWTEGSVSLWRATALGFSSLSWPEGDAQPDRFDREGMTFPGYQTAEVLA